MASECFIITDSEDEHDEELDAKKHTIEEKINKSGGGTPYNITTDNKSDDYSSNLREAGGDGKEQVDPDVEQPHTATSAEQRLSDSDDSDDDWDLFAQKRKQYEARLEETRRRVAAEESRLWAKYSAPAEDDLSISPCLDRTPVTPSKEERPTRRQNVLLTPTTGGDRPPRRSKRRRIAMSDDDDVESVENWTPPEKTNSSLTDMWNQLSKASRSELLEKQDSPVAPSAPVVEEVAARTLTVRVQALGRIIRRQMKTCEKLRSVFEQVSNELNVPLGRVCLGQGDVIYRPDQTPDDVKLGMFDIIEFWEGDSTAAAPAPVEDVPDGSIELHIQSAQRRGKLTLHLMPAQTMAELMQMYAAEKQTELSQLRFRFDGEALDPTATAESMDLETGDCIDVHEV